LCIAQLQFSMLQFNALRLVVHSMHKTMEFCLADSGSTGLERKVLDILCYLNTTMMFTMNNVANLENQMESRFCDVHFVRLKMDDDKSDLIWSWPCLWNLKDRHKVQYKFIVYWIVMWKILSISKRGCKLPDDLFVQACMGSPL
jgi:hypothetical protein